MDSQLAGYLAFTTLFVLTPGAATAVVVRNVLEGGRGQGIAAAVGAAAANSIYAAASVAGLIAIFARVPAAFLLVRFGGSAYLAYLGLRNLWRACRAGIPDVPGHNGRPRGTRGATRSGFTQGLTVNLMNPAVATFYMAAVPSFLGGPSAPRSHVMLYAGIHVTMAFCFHSAWACSLHAMRALWARPVARRVLEMLTGLALLALAAKVAWG